jgi:hypothetical protein
MAAVHGSGGCSGAKGGAGTGGTCLLVVLTEGEARSGVGLLGTAGWRQSDVRFREHLDQQEALAEAAAQRRGAIAA